MVKKVHTTEDAQACVSRGNGVQPVYPVAGGGQHIKACTGGDPGTLSLNSGGVISYFLLCDFLYLFAVQWVSFWLLRGKGRPQLWKE